MVAAAAQILFLDLPDHAAVDLAIRHLHEDPRSSRYVALGNALLRRLARERDAILAAGNLTLPFSMPLCCSDRNRYRLGLRAVNRAGLLSTLQSYFHSDAKLLLHHLLT